MRILVVDDDNVICTSMMKRIKRLNLSNVSTVLCAMSANDAIKIIEEYEGEWIVIADVCMPDINGLEMIRQMKTRFSDIHFIVLSAYGEFIYAREAIKLGVGDYLLKPCGMQDLRESIQKIQAEVILPKSCDERAIQYIINIFAGLWPYTTVKERLEADLQQCGMFQHNGFSLVAYPGMQKAPLIKKLPFLSIESKSLLLINHPLHSLVVDNIIIERNQYATLSSKRESLQQLPQMFQEVRQLLHTTIYQRSGKVLTWENEQKRKQVYVWGKNILKKLVICLRHLDIVGMRAILDTCFEQKILQEYSYKAVVQMFFVLQSIISSSRIEFGIIGKIQLEDLSAFNSISDMKEYLMQSAVALVENFAKQSKQPIVEWAKKYVKDNIENKIDMATIANMLNISYAYFSRLFKEYMGQSFSDYLNDMKMQEASRLLQKGEKVQDVAQMLGYTQQKNFSRAFIKYYGIAPSRWSRYCIYES